MSGLPICERLRHDPWPADDGARLEAADTIEALVEALEPFATFADPTGRIPHHFQVSQGSRMARRQITMGDCYTAKHALSRARNGGQP